MLPGSQDLLISSLVLELFLGFYELHHFLSINSALLNLVRVLYIVHNQGNFYTHALRNYGKKSQCPLLDLKYKQDYRVVVAAMTFSKLLRINCLGMEITLILCVYVCVYYIYIYCYILHSTKENVSKACNDGMMRHDVWIKDFSKFAILSIHPCSIMYWHCGQFSLRRLSLFLPPFTWIIYNCLMSFMWLPTFSPGCIYAMCTSC